MKYLNFKNPARGAFALFLACAASAQTFPPTTTPSRDIHVVANPTYVTIPVEITVDRPAAEVWSRIGKFCFFGEAMQSDCTILSGKDGELGALRSFGLEVLVGKTDLSYTYTQPVREGRPYNLYHGTLEVKPLTAATSKIVHTFMYDNSILRDDAAREEDKTYRAGLYLNVIRHMKVLAEGGEWLEPGPMVAFSAIVYNGHSLAGDGAGAYVDATNNSNVFNREALSLFVWKDVSPLSNKPDPAAIASRERYMTFDLSRPVEGSGAVKLSTGKDDLARFHVFWKHDHGSTERMSFMREIPIGTTVESDRVEMWVRINSVQHVLQMGPWAMGEFTDRAPIEGKGTSKASITRQNEDSWRIKAPNGSIARLWDYSDIGHPVDKGLYYFDFDVEFTKLK